MILHGYWRSGAAYRVRIALALKGLAYENRAHDLRTGAQRDAGYRALNPQGLVPALEADGAVVTQSGAIIEWLDETCPEPPLLPRDPVGRATVRAMAAAIACDIHPLQNLRVLQYLKRELGASDPARDAWLARWMGDGFAALETLAERHGGRFCYGDDPTLADCFLAPQLYSARRFGINLAPYAKLVAADAALRAIPEVAAAAPEAQPDADPA